MATVVERPARVTASGASYRLLAERYDERAEAALRDGNPARARDQRHAAATFRALADAAGERRVRSL